MKKKVPVYVYQQALDFYKSVKSETNVSDEQYSNHVKAIKEQGTTGEYVEVDPIYSAFKCGDSEGMNCYAYIDVNDTSKVYAASNYNVELDHRMFVRVKDASDLVVNSNFNYVEEGGVKKIIWKDTDTYMLTSEQDDIYE